MLWEIELGVLEKYILMAFKIVHLLLSPSGINDVALSFKDKLVAFTQRCLKKKFELTWVFLMLTST